MNSHITNNKWVKNNKAQGITTRLKHQLTDNDNKKQHNNKSNRDDNCNSKITKKDSTTVKDKSDRRVHGDKFGTAFEWSGDKHDMGSELGMLLLLGCSDKKPKLGAKLGIALVLFKGIALCWSKHMAQSVRTFPLPEGMMLGLSNSKGMLGNSIMPAAILLSCKMTGSCSILSVSTLFVPLLC